MKTTVSLGKGSSLLGSAAIAFTNVSVANDFGSYTLGTGELVQSVDFGEIEATTHHSETSTPIQFEGKSLVRDWNPVSEQRFLDLAAKFALDEISPEEAAELKKLERTRNLELSPRTYKELVREMEIEDAANEAVRALDRFIESVRKPWKRG